VRDIFKIAYRAKMSAQDTAEVLLYGEIISDMPEDWRWSKQDKSAADFDKAIKEVRAQGATKLLLRINSPGGVCTESVAMRSILAGAGFDEITIRIEGLCASAATDIATLPGAHVQIAEGSEYMIHNPWTWVIGNANELEHEIEHLRNIEQMSRGFYQKRSGQGEEQIKEWMDAETWFTAEEAVKYGFADELLTGAAKAAACVSTSEMRVMRGLYRTVPEAVRIERAEEDVRHDSPVAGEPSEINTKEEAHMDVKELTVEQLLDGNPALYQAVMQKGAQAERERMQEIDALTMPGYEEMAEAAKRDGTAAVDYYKQVVQAQRKKGADWMESRKEELEPAKQVSGGAAEDGYKTDEAEMAAFEKDIKAAIEQSYTQPGGMF